MDADLAEGQHRVDVQRDHRIHIGHHPFLDHTQRAALALAIAGLLGGLEHKAHPSAQALDGETLAQQVGGAEQHGGVGVVATGVHDTGVGGGETVRGSLHDGQRVHIGPDGDGRPVRITQVADDTGSSHPGANGYAADLAERISHEGGGARLLKAKLRVGMDVTPETHEFVREGVGAVEHGGSSFVCWGLVGSNDPTAAPGG